MVLDLPASDVELGLWLARAIKLFDNNGWKLSIDAAFQVATGVPVNSTVVTASEFTPKQYYGQSGRYTLYLVDNTPTIVAATRLWVGYRPIIYGGVFNQRNQWADNAWKIMANQLATNHMATPDVMIMGGHSAGGMIVQLYAAALIQADIRNVARVVTFGAPKPGFPYLGDLVQEPWTCRWMNDDDAVPLLPASDMRGAVLMSQGTVQDVASFLRYAHVAGGRSLRRSGSFVPSVLPEQAGDRPFLSIQAWIASSLTNQEDPHNLAEYIRRLELALPPLQGGGMWDEPPADREKPADIPPVLVRQQIRAFEGVMVEAGQRQGAQVAVIPDFQAFTVRREGRLHNVYFGDTRIAIGPTKRRARGYARIANDLLRRMQRMGVVDPEAFTEQMQAYLEAAAAPAGMFQPPMNINPLR